MHNSYFSTNDQLLDTAVGMYWTNRASAIEARKASEAKAKEDEMGTPFELTAEEAQRFNVKVKQGEGDDCDIWVAAKNETGYGAFGLRGRVGGAHIIAWQHANKRLADPSRDRVIAHLCQTAACVKPSHLDEQSQQQNMLYANDSQTAILRARTHCPKGHELTEENCRPDKWAQGHRSCRVCELARSRKLNVLIKAAREALGITGREYASLYGRSQATAIAIADNPNCEAAHRKK
jgi:hypothetical protein